MKVKVKDANEEVIEIEEQDSVSVELSEEELASLKKLLSKTDKLLALVDDKTTDSDEEEEEEIEDSDEEEEEVDDSDEEEENKKDAKEKKKKVKDSFKSIGAIQRKQKVKDSDEVAQDIDSAWVKRYGGK